MIIDERLKNTIKVLIVLWIASVIWLLLVRYTDRWAQYARESIYEMRTLLIKWLDAEPKISYEELLPTSQLSWWITTTWVIINSGSVPYEVLQERLQYYQDSKQELWWK